MFDELGSDYPGMRRLQQIVWNKPTAASTGLNVITSNMFRSVKNTARHVECIGDPLHLNLLSDALPCPWT
jgi:hypothetical protein